MLARLPESDRRDEGVSRGRALSFHLYGSLCREWVQVPRLRDERLWRPLPPVPGSPFLLRKVNRRANYWCRRKGSNLRHLDFRSSALPSELQRRICTTTDRPLHSPSIRVAYVSYNPWPSAASTSAASSKYGAGCENRTRLRRLGRPTGRHDQPARSSLDAGARPDDSARGHSHRLGFGGCPRIRTAKASDKRFTVSPRYRYGTRHPAMKSGPILAGFGEHPGTVFSP